MFCCCTLEALQEDMNMHHDELVELESSVAELRQSCSGQKQDVVLVNNLVSSLHKRWDRIKSLAFDRSKQLETAHKEAKHFYDAWKVVHPFFYTRCRSRIRSRSKSRFNSSLFYTRSRTRSRIRSRIRSRSRSRLKSRYLLH